MGYLRIVRAIIRVKENREKNGISLDLKLRIVSNF